MSPKLIEFLLEPNVSKSLLEVSRWSQDQCVFDAREGLWDVIIHHTIVVFGVCVSSVIWFVIGDDDDDESWEDGIDVVGTIVTKSFFYLVDPHLRRRVKKTTTFGRLVQLRSILIQAGMSDFARLNEDCQSRDSVFNVRLASSVSVTGLRVD